MHIQWHFAWCKRRDFAATYVHATSESSAAEDDVEYYSSSPASPNLLAVGSDEEDPATSSEDLFDPSGRQVRKIKSSRRLASSSGPTEYSLASSGSAPRQESYDGGSEADSSDLE